MIESKNKWKGKERKGREIDIDKGKNKERERASYTGEEKINRQKGQRRHIDIYNQTNKDSTRKIPVCKQALIYFILYLHVPGGQLSATYSFFIFSREVHVCLLCKGKNFISNRAMKTFKGSVYPNNII